MSCRGLRISGVLVRTALIRSAAQLDSGQRLDARASCASHVSPHAAIRCALTRSVTYVKGHKLPFQPTVLLRRATRPAVPSCPLRRDFISPCPLVDRQPRVNKNTRTCTATESANIAGPPPVQQPMRDRFTSDPPLQVQIPQTPEVTELEHRIKQRPARSI